MKEIILDDGMTTIRYIPFGVWEIQRKVRIDNVSYDLTPVYVNDKHIEAIIKLRRGKDWN